MASTYNNIPNSTRRPKDVNYFHISSVKRSINSCRVCSVSTPSIGQQMKNVVSLTVSMCSIQQRTQRSQRCVVVLTKPFLMDPLPANQIRDNITSIVSVITMITNNSLDEAVMPRLLKHAIVRPSLKKPSLDKDILSNYRPVSNLTQLSKVIIKVVALRIMTHVSDQQMVECFQSAYRKKTFD